MDYKVVYPDKHNKKKREYTFRIIVFSALTVAFITCGIVNICLKNGLWSLYVLVAEWLFWIVFIERPLVENSLVIKIQKIITAVGILLIANIAFLRQTSVSISIPLVLSGGQILVSSLLLLTYKNRNKDSFKLAYIALGLFILAGSLTLTIIFRAWYLYLVFGISALLIILVIILYRKDIHTEFRKRFCIKVN